MTILVVYAIVLMGFAVVMVLEDLVILAIVDINTKQLIHIPSKVTKLLLLAHSIYQLEYVLEVDSVMKLQEYARATPDMVILIISCQTTKHNNPNCNSLVSILNLKVVHHVISEHVGVPLHGLVMLMRTMLRNQSVQE